MQDVKNTSLQSTQEWDARIIRSARRVFTCRRIDSPPFQFDATARGNLLKQAELVCGDRVRVTVHYHSEQPSYEISELVPRENHIFRFLPRGREIKIIAANIDLMLIVVSLKRPDYKRGLIDRFLLRSHLWKVKALVIFNKADLLTESEFEQLGWQQEIERVQSLIDGAYVLSGHQPQWINPMAAAHQRLGIGDFLQLQQKIQHQTVLVIGQSGVGKSSLVSALTEQRIQLKHQELGKAGKGMHTTTWCELVEDGPYRLIDSPGIRGLSIDDIDRDDLLSLMPDVEQHALTCQFTNCNHDQHSKGCHFHHPSTTEALLSRLDSYLRFVQERTGHYRER
jgi:ribosome biogenesis GTPase / thiamine phosphate phosphatase